MHDSIYISFYLRANRIHIFCSALREMGCPKFIRFLVHADKLQMVMQSYHKKDFISFRVPKEVFSGGGSMEISSKPFCRLMAMRLGWNTDKSYRIPGRYFAVQKIVRFDLGSAVEIRQDRMSRPHRSARKYYPPVDSATPQSDFRVADHPRTQFGEYTTEEAPTEKEDIDEHHIQ